MRDSLFQKVLSVALCAVLLLGAFPMHTHAAALDEGQRQAVLGRQMDSWYFPLPKECFDSITDLAGCRRENENALHGGSNASCPDEGHSALTNGSEELIVNAGAGQPVYAPAGGTLYVAGGMDTKWSGAVVIEVPYDANFSYYLLLSGVGSNVGSGSYVEGGSVIGSTSGALRFACLMDYANMGTQIAQDADAEVATVSNYGWLVSSSGTGLICVNPSEDNGPISYQFVSDGQPTPPTEEIPPETTHEHSYQVDSAASVPATHTTNGNTHYVCSDCGASYDEPIPADTNAHVFDQTVVDDAHLASAATCSRAATYYYSCACGAIGTETFSYGEASGSHNYQVDSAASVPATHTTNGNTHYVCSDCGASYDEPIPATTEHTFDQEVVSEQYLASAATCSGPAQYYYSCLCGEKGSATFPYGEAAAHSFSDSWSHDDSNHWRAATCQHTGETTDFGPHRWDDGKITKDAGHNVNGEKVYTCIDCGFQKTEVIYGQPHEYNQQVVSDAYLASAATCTTPAQYYKSCVCGEKGTETFSNGEAKGHTFSDQWSSDENQHWQAATCEHTGERIKVAEHIWSPGVITTKPTATTKGVETFTCTVCGRTRTQEVEPTTHEHTFTDKWSGNSTYHWHEATCEHTNVVSGLGEHSWVLSGGSAAHTNGGTQTYICSVCQMQKTEAVAHTYNQQVATSQYLASAATCANPATYYYSCTCGAKGTETFSFGSALGHTASGTWGKDANYHWTVCTRCGAKGNLTAHSFDANGICTVCGGSKQDSHTHSSHLSRVPAKAATCTQEGNISYYICDCGMWFTDVTCTTAITDQQSVVLPAAGHVDADNNGRCDVCKERLDNTVEYQMTEGGESTWLNNSDQGMVFRSNADYSKFDRVEVDGATVASTNYTVSQGSTIVELSNSYLKRLSLGRHTISIVAKDGKATTGFTIKQGASAAASQGGSGIWPVILFLTVVIAVAIPVAYGVYYYRKKTGSY